MKRLWALLLCLCSTLSLADQTPLPSSSSFTAEVLAQLELTEVTEAQFTPIYAEYRLRLTRLNNRANRLIQAFTERYPDVDNDFATRLMDNIYALKQQNLDLRIQYRERFSSVLSPVEIIRLWQIENRTEAKQRYQLSQEIPLIQVREEKQP